MEQFADAPLTSVEVRVLGCLMEKAATTPDVYPLTLNTLRTACNQSSNRDPVVSYDDGTVQSALDTLRARSLTRVVYSTSNRATKYRHVLHETLGLEPAEVAVLTVLLLRGPQTVGEVRTRADRIHAFGSLAEVDEVVDRLAGRDEPLVRRLPRAPGQKDGRVSHLLAGEPVEPTPAARPASSEPGRDDRLDALEAEVAALRAEVAALRELFES